jgi:Tol biopolymer transport system component
VAFQSDPEGFGDLYAVDADGSDPTKLVESPTENQPAFTAPEAPAFSPGGEKIAFQRTVGVAYPDLYTVKPDGTGLTNVTDSDSVIEELPAFSPKRDQIAYVRGPTHDQGYEIYVMDLDGTNQLNLTESVGNDMQPTFSPDGKRIAFVSNRDGPGVQVPLNTEIYAMNADGSNQKRLTNDAALDDYPTFSSEGMRVAFTRTGFRSPNDSDVYVMNVDGTGLKRLTHYPAYDGQPAFVPGTDIVAFVSPRDGDDDIYALRSDGTGLTNLTSTDSASEAAPTFSADGTKMAYASIRQGESGKLVEEIYVMELDRTKATNGE